MQAKELHPVIWLVVRISEDRENQLQIKTGQPSNNYFSFDDQRRERTFSPLFFLLSRFFLTHQKNLTFFVFMSYNMEATLF